MGDTFMKFLYGYMILLGFVVFIIALSTNSSTGEQIRNELGIDNIDPPQEPETGNSAVDLLLIIIMPLAWIVYFISLFFVVSFSGWIGFVITIPAVVLFMWALARWFRGGG